VWPQAAAKPGSLDASDLARHSFGARMLGSIRVHRYRRAHLALGIGATPPSSRWLASPAAALGRCKNPDELVLLRSPGLYRPRLE